MSELLKLDLFSNTNKDNFNKDNFNKDFSQEDQATTTYIPEEESSEDEIVTYPSTSYI